MSQSETISSWDDLTPTGRMPSQSELPERVWALEQSVRQLATALRARAKEDGDTKRWLRGATITLIIAIAGAMVTVGITGIGAAVAYGELRQLSRGNGEQIERLQSEITALRRELHGSSR